MNLEGLEKIHTDKQAEQLLLPPDSEQDFLPKASLIRPDLAPQNVFGYFVQIASRIVEAYHSDLYYDATTLADKDWNRELTLWYTVGDCGTNLLDSLHDADKMRQHGRPHVYQVLYRRSERLPKYFVLTIRKIYSPEDK